MGGVVFALCVFVGVLFLVSVDAFCLIVIVLACFLVFALHLLWADVLNMCGVSFVVCAVVVFVMCVCRCCCVLWLFNLVCVCCVCFCVVCCLCDVYC